MNLSLSVPSLFQSLPSNLSEYIDMISFARPISLLGGLTTLLAVAHAQNGSEPIAACQALASSLAIENTTVNFAQYVTAGTNLSLSQEGELPTCGEPFVVAPVDLCRVAMYVSTTNRSGITLEAFLPTNWTGRFLMTGNGGISGCLQYRDVAYAASFGFASFGQNGGHNGTAGTAFYQNEDVVEDYVYRGLHTGVVVGKQVTQAYYNSNYTKSYYLGCSTGGKQGFKSVQEFPEDFDGVVAGAPALYSPALTAWSGHFYPILGSSNSSTFVPSALWLVIHDEILKQCDGLDGVSDGIVEDVDLCQFRPEALQCAPGATNTTACLTGAQVGAVREVFSDYYGLDGELIFPRMQPGSELVARFLYYSGRPFAYTTDWYRYVVYQDPNWDPTTFTRVDAEAAIDQNPFGAMSNKSDLSAYQSRGGKILHWHGQMDAIISSTTSPRYYNQVSRTMNLPSSSLDDFYRFFRVSGGGHCSGGDGAHMVGQAATEETTRDPQNNILSRIVAWVEEGSAPETITGTKYVNDDPAQGVAFVRNHCRYPFRNVCTDPDNYTSPDAWACV
ncbi:feruloyl esterase B-2-like protein 3 [Phlyctema vagabunda]|uniref:Carboxylic ester hydrolase n=1 Tax=Phlyctema vagabunda TaxID=108571 RepID=A0ABR4P9Y8_9HELO